VRLGAQTSTFLTRSCRSPAGLAPLGPRFRTLTGPAELDPPVRRVTPFNLARIRPARRRRGLFLLARTRRRLTSGRAVAWADGVGSVQVRLRTERDGLGTVRSGSRDGASHRVADSIVKEHQTRRAMASRNEPAGTDRCPPPYIQTAVRARLAASDASRRECSFFREFRRTNLRFLLFCGVRARQLKSGAADLRPTLLLVLGQIDRPVRIRRVVRPPVRPDDEHQRQFHHLSHERPPRHALRTAE